MSETVITMLQKVKTALRISSGTTAFDGELTDLIEACKLDLGIAGVKNDDLVVGTDPTDQLFILAIITYCKMNFGEPNDYDRLKSSYDEQKAQLSIATGYTNYGEA